MASGKSKKQTRTSKHKPYHERQKHVTTANKARRAAKRARVAASPKAQERAIKRKEKHDQRYGLNKERNRLRAIADAERAFRLKQKDKNLLVEAEKQARLEDFTEPYGDGVSIIHG